MLVPVILPSLQWTRLGLSLRLLSLCPVQPSVNDQPVRTQHTFGDAGLADCSFFTTAGRSTITTEIFLLLLLLLLLDLRPS